MRNLMHLCLGLGLWVSTGCVAASEDSQGLNVDTADRVRGVSATYLATNGVLLTINAKSDGTTVTSMISHDGLLVTQLSMPDNDRGYFTQDPMPFITQAIEHSSAALRLMAETPHRVPDVLEAYEQLSVSIATDPRFDQLPHLRHAIGLHESIYSQARSVVGTSLLKDPKVMNLIQVSGDEIGFYDFDAFNEWDFDNDGLDDVGSGAAPEWRSPNAEVLSPQEPPPVEDENIPANQPTPKPDRMGDYRNPDGTGNVAGYIRDNCPGAMGPGCSWCSIGAGNSSVSCWETSFSIWHDKHCGAWLKFFSCHQ